MLCANFRHKETKFEPLYASKCIERFKNLKNAT